MNSALGKWMVESLDGLGRFAILTREAVMSAVTLKVSLRDFVYQMYFIGVRSLTLIVLSGVTIGMVMGLQFYIILERFGSTNLLGAGVSLSVILELGPVMTALMVVLANLLVDISYGWLDPRIRYQ